MESVQVHRYDSTHPAQPHVVAALLQLQGLQQLLHCLQNQQEQTVRRHINKNNSALFRALPYL